jgi:uncharacterized protein (DUF342 family)
LRTR